MKVIIEAFPTPDVWRFSGTAKLRIYARQSFFNSDGQFVPQGIPGRSETAYLEIDCVVADNQLIVPSFEIDSTVDGLDNVFATYDAEFVVGSRRVPFLNSFPVNTLQVGDPSTTWPEIIILKNLFEPRTLDDNLTRQLAALVQTAAGQLSKASGTNTGVTALDVDPVDPIFPIAVGANSPLLLGLSSVVNGLANGMVDDAAIIEDATINLGAPTSLTSVTGGLGASIIGKTIAVPGAGPAGATLITTIQAVPNVNTITLASAASTAVSNAHAVYGTDNTAALVGLAAAVPALGSKSAIFLPKGNYLFSTNTQITLPQGVSILGSWETAPDHMGYRYADEPKPMAGEGTTFVIVAGEGSVAGRFMFLNSESSVRGISFFYPAQLEDLATPKLYPWTIEMFGTGPTVENVEVLNSYQGIYSHIGQRHYINNVRGTPILTGLYASQQLETSRYTNITFVPIYTFSTTELAPFPHTALMDWISKNGTAFKCGRVDNATFFNCFSFDYFKGVKFVIDGAEATAYANGTGAPGGKAWAQFVSCGFDTCTTPVDVDDVQGLDASTAAGVTFTDCMFCAAQWNPFASTEIYGIYCRATFTGRIGVHNSRFTQGDVNIVNAANGGRLNIVGNYFQKWNVKSIDTNGTATISANTFKIGNPAPVIVSTASGANAAWIACDGNMIEYTQHTAFNVHADANFEPQGNTYLDGPKWIALTLANGWANFGGGYQTARYIKRDNWVEIQGVISGGVTVPATALAAALPAGHRPLNHLLFQADSNGAYGLVQVASDGVISIQAGGNVSLTLNLRFSIR